VLVQLDQWLDGPGETGWVVVTGGPGMGKSAILSAWLARREATGAMVPHHFVRRQVADWDQPEVIAASLAAQIEAAFPALRAPDAKPERRLLELLGRVSKQLGAARRLVVVVDGLDETRAEPGENPLPRFLPHVVPAGIRFLCATRPTYPHLSWLEARSPVRRLDLDDPQWAASNEAVVRGFWEAVACQYQPPLPAETMAAAIARAEGNVLHAVMLHDALRGLPAEQHRADRIPRGLKELIGECAAIERELRMTTHRDDFELRSKWAVIIDEMMRHLNELHPTIIQFSGHGTNTQSAPAHSSMGARDLVVPPAGGGASGIYLQDEHGEPQLVTTRALTMMIKSAAASARVVVLNACYSDVQADALCSVVDCVIGMTGAISDDAARAFAVGFYRALGNRRSVGNAVDQAIATLAARRLPDEYRPRCRTRDGVDAYQIILGPPA
jgi:hypothetical protein